MILTIIIQDKIQDQRFLEAIEGRCKRPGRNIQVHPNIDEAIQALEQGASLNERQVVFLIVDDNCPGPNDWTWGEEQVKQLRQKNTVGFSMAPCLLIGLRTVFDRIARKRECWAFRYVCHTMDWMTFQRADDPLADFQRWPIASWKAFGASHACMARIHEYLSWMKDGDPDFNQATLALSRNITHNTSLDIPFPTFHLKHLIRTGLKRHEIHDFKAISGVGPLCLLEGMYRLGEIDFEFYRKGAKDILETIGYPDVVIQDIVSLKKNVPIVTHELVRSARATMQGKKILLIDDHPELWKVAVELALSGASVLVMSEPFDLNKVKSEIDKADLVLLDLYFDNIPTEQQVRIQEDYGNKAWGLYLLDYAFDRKPVVPVLMFTTSERADRASSSLRFGVTEFITKETLTDDPDPVGFTVSFFRTIRSAMLWADVLIPSYEAIEVLRELHLDVFPLQNILLGIQDAATPLGRRLGHTPLGQAAVAIKTFYEENQQIPQSTSPVVFGFLCNNLRNASAHGRVGLMCKLDVLIAWCSFLAGFQLQRRFAPARSASASSTPRSLAGFQLQRRNESIHRLKEKARNISRAFWRLLRENSVSVVNMNEKSWMLPDNPSNDAVKIVCKEIWRKICENAREKELCSKRETGFIPKTIIDKDGAQIPPNFIEPESNRGCCYSDKGMGPSFARVHQREGRRMLERVFCVYHSFHPSAFMLFDIIQCVLEPCELKMAHEFYELMGLRAEHLYVQNFQTECGPLSAYRYLKQQHPHVSE